MSMKGGLTRALPPRTQAYSIQPPPTNPPKSPSCVIRSVIKWKGVEALQEVIALGKKGKVSKRTELAAYQAQLKCSGAAAKPKPGR